MVIRRDDLYTTCALILVLIGGINWGLIGLVQLNLVGTIFGYGWLARLIYLLVGVAAGYLCYLIYAERSKPTLPS